MMAQSSNCVIPSDRVTTPKQVGSGPCGFLAKSVSLEQLLLPPTCLWHPTPALAHWSQQTLSYVCRSAQINFLVPLNFLGLPGELLLNSLYKVVQNTLNAASDRDRYSWTKEKKKSAERLMSPRSWDYEMAQMMWLKRIGWRPASCKGQDWAANGKATEAGKGGDCRLKKGKAHISATPTPRCCWIRQEIHWALQGTPSGPPHMDTQQAAAVVPQKIWFLWLLGVYGALSHLWPATLPPTDLCDSLTTVSSHPCSWGNQGEKGWRQLPPFASASLRSGVCPPALTPPWS